MVVFDVVFSWSRFLPIWTWTIIVSHRCPNNGLAFVTHYRQSWLRWTIGQEEYKKGNAIIQVWFLNRVSYEYSSFFLCNPRRRRFRFVHVAKIFLVCCYELFATAVLLFSMNFLILFTQTGRDFSSTSWFPLFCKLVSTSSGKGREKPIPILSQLYLKQIFTFMIGWEHGTLLWTKKFGFLHFSVVFYCVSCCKHTHTLSPWIVHEATTTKAAAPEPGASSGKVITVDDLINVISIRVPGWLDCFFFVSNQRSNSIQSVNTIMLSVNGPQCRWVNSNRNGTTATAAIYSSSIFLGWFVTKTDTRKVASECSCWRHLNEEQNGILLANTMNDAKERNGNKTKKVH